MAVSRRRRLHFTPLGGDIRHLLAAQVDLGASSSMEATFHSSRVVCHRYAARRFIPPVHHGRGRPGPAPGDDQEQPARLLDRRYPAVVVVWIHFGDVPVQALFTPQSAALEVADATPRLVTQ